MEPPETASVETHEVDEGDLLVQAGPASPLPLGDRVFVESVSVQNFRGITSCFLKLEPGLTLLVGPNSSGKSRLLRAIGIALGDVIAESDDITVGSQDYPIIDVVIAPIPSAGDEAFSTRYARVLNPVQQVLGSPSKERFAWRTLILRSSEGLGVRTESYQLVFNVTLGEWSLPAPAEAVRLEQRRLFSANLIEPNRDLAAEFSRRGSAIRRVLDELEITSSDRAAIESALGGLGSTITQKSGALKAVTEALERLEQRVGAVSGPKVQPLPTRLEELARSVTITLNSGSGADLPLRLHGSGSRSLASLQAQGVMYERRLGADGPNLQPLPVTLIEEPEAHLHPQAQAALALILNDLRGQVIASTHSPQLVTAAPPSSARILQNSGGLVAVKDLLPADNWMPGQPRLRNPRLNAEEIEKLKRFVERPFGELLFSSGIVIGDGATERAFLPPLLAYVMGAKAATISVVDPGSLGTDFALAVAKFAEAMNIPWLLFSDSDSEGVAAATRLDKSQGNGDGAKIVWVGDPESSPGAIEAHMIDFDNALCEDVALSLDVAASSKGALSCLTAKKGISGGLLAAALMEKYPDRDSILAIPGYWPTAVQALMRAITREF